MGARPGVSISQRGAAEAYQDRSPHYAITLARRVSGAARAPPREVVGRVASSSGGEQYSSSQTAADLAGCKGHKLASDHFTDALRRAVSRRDHARGLPARKNQRPLRVAPGAGQRDGLRAARRRPAEEHHRGSDAVVVWQSRSRRRWQSCLPGRPAEKKKFRESLVGVCEGDGAVAQGRDPRAFLRVGATRRWCRRMANERLPWSAALCARCSRPPVPPPRPPVVNADLTRRPAGRCARHVGGARS